MARTLPQIDADLTALEDLVEALIQRLDPRSVIEPEQAFDSEARKKLYLGRSAAWRAKRNVRSTGEQP